VFEILGSDDGCKLTTHLGTTDKSLQATPTMKRDNGCRRRYLSVLKPYYYYTMLYTQWLTAVYKTALLL